MSILELGTVIFQPVASIISWMQGKHLLAASMTCSACNTGMTLSDRADISDGCRLVSLFIVHCSFIVFIEYIIFKQAIPAKAFYCSPGATGTNLYA